jgi:hypothetical protein
MVATVPRPNCHGPFLDIIWVCVLSFQKGRFSHCPKWGLNLCQDLRCCLIPVCHKWLHDGRRKSWHRDDTSNQFQIECSSSPITGGFLNLWQAMKYLKPFTFSGKKVLGVPNSSKLPLVWYSTTWYMHVYAVWSFHSHLGCFLIAMFMDIWGCPAPYICKNK